MNGFQMFKYPALLIFITAWTLVPSVFADEAEDYQSAQNAYDQGQFLQAVQGFARVIQEDPNSWQAYQGFGSSLLQQGDRQGALQAYQKSLALHPDNPEVQAAVDKILGKVNPATPTTNPGSQPLPASSPATGKPDPILITQAGTDKNPTEIYYYHDTRLDGYPQFEDVIDPLHDTEASHLLRDSEKTETGAMASLVVGGLSVAGGIVYFVAAQPTTQMVGGLFGLPLIKPADATPGLILCGAGVALGLVGGLLDGESGKEKRDAVMRYDHLIGQDQNPVRTAGSTGTEETPNSSMTAMSSPTTSGSPAPLVPVASDAVSGPSTPPIPHDPFAFGVSPLLSVPLSSHTSSEYVLGSGVEAEVEYLLDKNFSLRFNLGLVSFPVNQANFDSSYQQVYGTPPPASLSISGGWSYVPIRAQIQFSLPLADSHVVPYVFWGGGVAFNSLNVSAAYAGSFASAQTGETDLLMSQGVGLGFRPDPRFEIFAQCGWDVNFTTQNGTDTINISGNPSQKGNLSDDGPTIFMPLQLGVRFWQ